MNRRHFLSLLAIGAAVAAVDPERLIWTPGERTHILPPLHGWNGAEYWYRQPPTLKFHKDAFSLVMNPWGDDDLRAAVKALADHIDAEGLRMYEAAAKDLEYGRGEQWPIRYRVARIAPCRVYIDPESQS